jgi:transcriptional regulator with XRE-family HTH domain
VFAYCAHPRSRITRGGALTASPLDRISPIDHKLVQSDAGSTVLRMTLGAQLRQLREASQISREVAGERIRASQAKISRLELGRVGFKQRDVADLLTLYGVTDEQQREDLLTLARRASSPAWWRQYGDVLPVWFERYFGLEQAASVIRLYEPQLVPGLLQTQDYSRAVVRLRHLHASPEEIERRVDMRMARQGFLTQDGAPTLWAVLDEAALRRPLGNAEILRAQLRHLIEMAELPNITLQVLPLRVGGHAATGGPFTILRFTQSDLPDIVYLEHLNSALYLDKKRDITDYQTVMDYLCVQAESPAKTIDFLHGIIEKS